MSQRELIAALRAVESALGEVEGALEAATPTRSEGGDATGTAEASVPIGVKGGAGGLRGDLQSLAGKVPGGGLLAGAIASPLLAAGGGLAAAGVALGGAGLRQGLVSASQGGNFGAGFTTGVNRFLGDVPVLGEVGGFAAANRIERGKNITQLQSTVEEIEAFGGGIDPAIKRRLIRSNLGFDARRERSRQDFEAAKQEQLAEDPSTLEQGRGRRLSQDQVEGTLFNTLRHTNAAVFAASGIYELVRKAQGLRIFG